MQTVSPSQFKKGMVVMLQGAPCLIEQFHLTGTAQAKPKLHAKLRNLRTGRFVEHVFAEHEHVPVADLETRRVQFSYQQGDTYVFLDTQSYEELSLSAEQIGDRKWFLRENEECKAYFLEGKLLDIVLPESVALKVIETAAPQKGGSDSAWKSATVEGGLEIMVPLFIAPGELIRVDTRERKYLGKAAHESRPG